MNTQRHQRREEAYPNILALELRSTTPVQKAKLRVEQSKRWFINLAASVLFR